MTISKSLFLLLEKRIRIPLLLGVFILLFIPYFYIVSIILMFFIASGFYIDKYCEKLMTQITLEWKQLEPIFFKEEVSEFRLDITNINLINEMASSMLIRTHSDNHYSIRLKDEKDSLVSCSQLPNQMIFHLTSHRRGPISMPEISITLGLPLWLGSLTVHLAPPLQWNVYPSITSVHSQQLKAELKLGERLSLYSPIKDRLQQISSKSYENEPSRQIDWYATAKKASLQTKVYQPVNQDMFTIFLDLSSPNGVGLHHRFEELIEHTALLTRELIESGGKVELFINRIDSSGQINHLKVSEGAPQLKFVLELLSSLSNQDHFMNKDRFLTYVMSVKNKQAQFVPII